MKIKVLICDDDLLFLTKVESYLQAFFQEAGVKAEIHAYRTWEEIGTALLASCDIAILDIYFSQEKYTGIDIAKQLREAREDAVIIFLTNCIEFAPEGYEVQAFRYILKSEFSRKMESCLTLALNYLNASKETMKIQINGEIIDIRFSDILYFEVQQHTVIAYVENECANKVTKQYRFYASLSALEKQLAPHGFLKIQKSYLVNMEKINKFQCHEAVLTNGTTLPVSTRTYAQQKEKYLLWKGK